MADVVSDLRVSTWTVTGAVLDHGENWMLKTAGKVCGSHTGWSALSMSMSHDRSPGFSNGSCRASVPPGTGLLPDVGLGVAVAESGAGTSLGAGVGVSVGTGAGVDVSMATTAGVSVGGELDTSVGEGLSCGVQTGAPSSGGIAGSTGGQASTGMLGSAGSGSSGLTWARPMGTPNPTANASSAAARTT